MQQRLQRPPLALVRRNLRQHSSDEMMLIGEPDQGETVLFRALREAGPIDVRRDVRVSDFTQR